METLIYPYPAECRRNGGFIPLERMDLVILPGTPERDAFPARLFVEWVADEFLVDIPIVSGPPRRGRLPIWIGLDSGIPAFARRAGAEGAPDRAEGYELVVSPGGIVAAGRDLAGARFAVASLVQLLRLRGGGLIAPCVRVRDWPYLPLRMVHLFLPGAEALPLFRRYMRDFLLRYRFNGMVLEVGGGMRLESRPEVSTGWRRTVRELYGHGEVVWKWGESGPLGPRHRFQDTTHRGVGGGGCIEKSDVRQLVEFARRLGQDVVPEIQSLSHVYHLACAHREIAELPDALFPDAYCPSNPASYRILFDVMDEYIEAMRPKIVHIGHDEWRAGGLCPRCRRRNTGRLFAGDVIRIYRHLRERGIRTWMWGDHFVSGHNERGRSYGSPRHVWYDRPSTEGAWRRVRKECPDLELLNWSWGLRRKGDAVGCYDVELSRKGFRFLYGNFDGLRFEDWDERVRRHGVLGAEVSSWCAMDEFELGKMHVPPALASIPMLWSERRPPAARIAIDAADRLPAVRERLRGNVLPPPPNPRAQHPLDLAARANAPLRTARWDLSGLRQGAFRHAGLAVRLGPRALVVRRPHQPRLPFPSEIDIPFNGRAAALTFLQTSSGGGRPSIHAGDATFFPHDSSELLGVYDIRFEDGAVMESDIRYEENVLAWDAGLSKLLYHARCIPAGTRPDGAPLAIWGSEWINPRPDVAIRSIRFRGARGSSGCLPILLGITASAKPRLRDFRRA